MKLLLAMTLFMFGCSIHPTITNDEAIAETKKCEAAGMRPVREVDGWANRTVAIWCVPKEE